MHLAQTHDAQGRTPTPELTFAGEKTLDQVSHTDWDTDFAYAINAGRGHVTETLNLATLNARGGIDIPTGTKVSFTLDGHLADPLANADALANGAKVSDGATPSAPTLPTVALSPDQFKQLAQDLSAQPGLAYLGDLAQRPDINWQAIATAHQQWDYKTQGLTEAGALLVALVVGYALPPGLGANLLNSAGATTTTLSTVAATGASVSTTVGLGSTVAATTTLAGAVTTEVARFVRTDFPVS